MSRNDPYYQCPPAVAARLLPLLPEVRAYTGDAPADAGPAAAGPAPVLRKMDAVLTALGAAEYRIAEPGRASFGARRSGPWGTGMSSARPRRRAPGPAAMRRPRACRSRWGGRSSRETRRRACRRRRAWSSPDEALFFVRLLGALGLARRAGQAMVPDTPAVESLRRQPDGAREREALDAALAFDDWSELDLLVAADPTLAVFRAASLHYIEPSHMRADVSHVRQALMRLLAWLPIGPWYDVNTLLGTLHRCFPQLPVTSQPVAGAWEQQTWWLARADGKGGWHYLDRRRLADWQRGLGRLAGLMLSRTFTWLGLVEATGPRRRAAAAGRGRPRRLSPAPPATSLSGRPAALLRVQPRPAGVAPDPAVAPALRFQAAAGGPLLVLDLRAVSLDVQMRLAAFADLAHADRDLCAYRLPPASVRAGFDAGLDYTAIAATLAALAGGPLPPALTERLAAWWGAYGRLRFYTGVSLIQFSEDFTLAELLASTTLGEYLLYQFSPRLRRRPFRQRGPADWQPSRAGHTPRVLDELRAAGAG